MIAESLINKVCVFWFPYENCAGGVSKPGTALVGACIAATPTEPTKRGSLPDLSVKLRGRSGKELTVSFVESRAQPFDTWAAALKYAETT